MHFFTLLIFLLACFASVPIFAMEKELDDQANHSLIKIPSRFEEVLTGTINRETYRLFKQEAAQFKCEQQYDNEAKKRLQLVSVYGQKYDERLEYDLLDLAEAFQNCKNYAEEAQVRDWILFYLEEIKKPHSPYYDGSTNHPFDDSQNTLTICSEDTKKSRNLIEAARAHSRNNKYLRATELWELCLSPKYECYLEKRNDYKECIQHAVRSYQEVGNLQREVDLRYVLLKGMDVVLYQKKWLKWATLSLQIYPQKTTDPLNICIELIKNDCISEALKIEARALITQYDSLIFKRYPDLTPKVQKRFCAIL